MKLRTLISGIAAAFLVVACNSTTNEENNNEHQETALSEEELIKEGGRLVLALGCDDCHSPKVMTDRGPIPDETRRLSGHPADLEIADYDASMVSSGQWVLLGSHFTAAVGPWGVSFSGNITPHETGIGNWTLENFTKALREGKYKGLDNARPLLPPMPWPGYQHLKDSEVEAIFTYLKSIPPVDNIVPTAIINPPPGG